jgi:[acyl-carrier-protein] S-malonyltransferase
MPPLLLKKLMRNIKEIVMNKKKIAFIFSGQGAQYVGMGKSLYHSFSEYKECFEEAQDVMHENYLKLSLEGPLETLTLTKNSQPSIFLMSCAIIRVLEKQFPKLSPSFVSGLSLGEYSALTTGGYLSFEETCKLVQLRAKVMHQACEETKGVMSVVMGLSAEAVESIVKDLNLPNDLWAANFNAPGQVVISGTEKGISAGTALAKERGAKRVIPLTVHGAFHSGLMASAEATLGEHLAQTPLHLGTVPLIMNVTGTLEDNVEAIRSNLLKQLTHSVRWEQGIRTLENQTIDLYVEIGPGTVLKGLNKRIGVKAPTVNIECAADLDKLAECLEIPLEVTE